MRPYSTGLASNTSWRLAVHATVLHGVSSRDWASLAESNAYDGVFLELEPGANPPSIPHGLHVTCLAFEPDDANPVEPARASELADLIGAPTLRVCGASMFENSYAQAYEATLRTCEAYAEAARKRGIRILLHQRWGTVTASASQLFRVLESFDPHDVGCIYDPGSMTIEGYEEYRIGLEILGSYVGDVHIANTRHFPPPAGDGAEPSTVWEWEWSPLSDGLLDLYRLTHALKRHNYAGWITLADRSSGPPAPVKLESTRRILQQAMQDLEGIGSHNPVRALDDHVDLAERPMRQVARISMAGHL